MSPSFAAAMLVGRLLTGADLTAAEPAPEPLLPEGTLTVVHFSVENVPAAAPAPQLADTSQCTCNQQPVMQERVPNTLMLTPVQMARGIVPWWLVGGAPLFINQSLDSIPQGGFYVPWGTWRGSDAMGAGGAVLTPWGVATGTSQQAGYGSW